MCVAFGKCENTHGSALDIRIALHFWWELDRLAQTLIHMGADESKTVEAAKMLMTDILLKEFPFGATFHQQLGTTGTEWMGESQLSIVPRAETADGIP